LRISQSLNLRSFTDNSFLKIAASGQKIFSGSLPLTPQDGSLVCQETDAVREVVRQTQANFQDSRPPTRNLVTQDTVILTGAAPSLPSFTPLASLTSPAAAIYSFLTDIPAEEEAEAVELAKPDLKIDKNLTEEAEECVKERKTGSDGEDERELDREEYALTFFFVFLFSLRSHSCVPSHIVLSPS